MRITPTWLIVILFLLPVINADADTARTFQQVDPDGQPIGPPKTIVFPDQPNSSATGHMTTNGNQSSPNFQIPDAIQPREVPDSGDMVPEGGND